MKKILVITGPTATGKTKLALALAQKFNGEIISADSRQVFKKMDIGTGKDMPANSNRGDHYEVEGVKIWGLDLVDPKEDFSVAEYIKFVRIAIKQIQERNNLPILVGGTGLYIRAAIDGIATSNVPRNPNLRKTLEQKSTEELFESLAQLDPVKAGSMNRSDRANPRRLIRAIEIATWRLDEGAKRTVKKSANVLSKDTLFVGLSIPKDILAKKIKERVELRMKKGIIKEISRLLENGVTWSSQSMATLGYREWKDYITGGKGEKEVAIQKWIKDEINYAKRQATWFKKEIRINWFDITKADWQKKVEKLVKKWYSSLS